MIKTRNKNNSRIQILYKIKASFKISKEALKCKQLLDYLKMKIESQERKQEKYFKSKILLTQNLNLLMKKTKVLIKTNARIIPKKTIANKRNLVVGKSSIVRVYNKIL